MVLPQFNEENVDSPHGTEQQRLDCNGKAKEDCHLVAAKVIIRRVDACSVKDGLVITAR